VRRSTAAPGREFVRYGGETSCVALSHDGEAPSLVLDAGTGLRGLSRALSGRPFVGTVLLSHLHWDHVHGIPFFGAGRLPRSRTMLLVPAQGVAEELLARTMSPPCFPIRPDELEGHWQFESFEAGSHEIDGWNVLALDIPHGGGRTFGFRVTDGRATIAYLSDHSPLQLGWGPDGLGAYHDAALALAKNADLLIHDAQHVAAELPDVAYLNHATVEYAGNLAAAAGVRRLLLYHHDPDRTDEQIDDILSHHRANGAQSEAAAEGIVVHLD
jgi:ribonuclease BN (tRNA processing enzyme)